MMRPFKETISLAEARAIIDAAIKPIDRTERVPLSQANGRVVARTVTALSDVPPFARAAMDGYAVKAGDTSGASRAEPKALRWIEQVFTGQVPVLMVDHGLCTEVATGAPMPAGADAVVIVEDTARDSDGHVLVFAPVHSGQNIGRKGGDIHPGQHVLEAGTFLNASRVGALAAIGHTEVEVYAKPRVAILSTGNEIVEPGQPLAPGQIHDVNSHTLAAVVSDHGGIPVPHRAAADTIDDLSHAVDRCMNEDLLVFSGGSSVGERDLVLDVLTARGEMLFHGVAVKPGKPTAFGRIAGKLFFGMPGYPASCLSNAYIFLAPALRRIAHLPAQTIRSMAMPLGARVTSAPGRHQFYTVRVADGVAMPAFKASGDITSMSQADGYIEITAETDSVEKGTIVEVKLF